MYQSFDDGQKELEKYQSGLARVPQDAISSRIYRLCKDRENNRVKQKLGNVGGMTGSDVRPH